MTSSARASPQVLQSKCPPAVRYDYYKTRLNRDVRSDASRELLDLTVERVGSLSVLLIMTFRPEFQPPWAGRGDPAGPAIRRAHRDAG